MKIVVVLFTSSDGGDGYLTEDNDNGNNCINTVVMQTYLKCWMIS